MLLYIYVLYFFLMLLQVVTAVYMQYVSMPGELP